MKRRTFLALPAMGWWTIHAFAAEKSPLMGEAHAATLWFIGGQRNDDGGFRVAVDPSPSELGAVVSGTRAYHYLGARVPNPESAKAFIGRCHDGTLFLSKPGGSASVQSAAMGVMALSQLGAADDARVRAAASYLSEKPVSIPEIYIAAAALDAANLPRPAAAKWTQAIDSTRNADGSFGTGAYDTATAIATLMRLGKPARDWSHAVAALRAGQREDGGFAALGDASDLSSTYRVTRAFHVLREKPDMARLRGFIRRCRNADGGYGPQPGKPSTLPATYNAVIVLHWLDELAG